MAPTSVSPAFDKTGYWSPNTASIDWCENNYVISYYVAEFWNSMSSFFIAAFGVLGYMTLPRNSPIQHKLIFVIFAMVGLGSVLFHGSLLHKTQMLDEMPMLYCSTLLIFTCIETKYGKQGRWLPICTAIWLAVTTTFFSMTTGTLQSLTFQTNNILMQVGVVYLLRGFYVQRQSIRPNAFIVPLTKVSLGAAVIAALTWLIDYNLCVYINGVSPETLTSFNPQFHAVWHFFSGMAMFGVSILVIYYHHDMRKDNSSPSIYLWRRVLPAVSLQASSSKKKQ